MQMLSHKSGSISEKLHGKERAAEGMLGLAKGLAVIESFSNRNPRMTVADVARTVRLNRATARRCLLTLVDGGYLSHDGKYFQPTPRLLRLGEAYMAAAPLPQLAQPMLENAREKLNESVSLAVYEDGWSVFVARAQADHVVTIGIRIGARLPAYCCATGRVLLSGLSEQALTDYLEQCQLEVRAPKSLTDKSAIRRAIEAVRETNFAVTDDELEIGIRSIATPVWSSSGTLVATISTSAFATRISLDKMVTVFLPVLTRAAERLGRAL